MKLCKFIGFGALILTALSINSFAADQATNAVAATPYEYDSMFTVNNLWLLIATFLVFMMHLGFADIRIWVDACKKIL